MPRNGVTVEFVVDMNVLEDDRADNPASLDAAFLRQTLFQMPVTVRVGDVTVFKGRTGIYYMATTGLEVIESLIWHKNAELRPPLGGMLQFEVSGEDVVIRDVGSGVTGRAKLSELRDAWATFAHDVKVFLLHEFPELKDHRQVGKWFRGE